VTKSSPRVHDSELDINASVHETCFVAKSKIGFWSRLKENVEFRESVLGDYSYISKDSIVNKTTIGRFTSVGPGCYIGLWEHNVTVSTHSFYLYESSGGFVKGYKNYDKDYLTTTVGSDVWIGAGAIIRKGVTIGSGAIIGAGSVVTKDVEPYEIVAGIPARHMRFRFSEKDRKFFMGLNWWNLSREELQKAVDLGLFSDFEAFKAYFGGAV
jgi:acetyltransferase-like isoleucine patch superfamily enzyme